MNYLTTRCSGYLQIDYKIWGCSANEIGRANRRRLLAARACPYIVAQTSQTTIYSPLIIEHYIKLAKLQDRAAQGRICDRISPLSSRDRLWPGITQRSLNVQTGNQDYGDNSPESRLLISVAALPQSRLC